MFSNKKDGAFYDLLEAQAQAAYDAASTFHALTGDFSEVRSYLKALEDIEHKADKITHDAVNRVNTQFITPLDKEDMIGLTDRLDDVTDVIEKAASRIEVYRLKSPRPEL